jgi:hypothetical protein
MDKFAKNNGYKKVQGEKIQGQQVYFNKKGAPKYIVLFSASCTASTAITTPLAMASPTADTASATGSAILEPT